MQNYSDLFIIGGGINGTAIAADAAGRGLSVTLCEKNDLSSGTSSASSKLIHGGLRYLEFYEFGLVKKALHEREVLLNRAPHLISPLEFVLPYEKHLRPAWMIRIGLFLYDHLAKRRLIPGSKSVSFKTDIRGKGLLPHLEKGFSYYDCFTDDTRLVITNALSAKENGARILPRHAFLNATRENDHWKIEIKNLKNDEISIYYAKALVNVAGPWVKEIQNQIQTTMQFDIQLDKGSHIVVPKIYEGDFAYILQNSDNRIVFAIPYHNQYTLIGTTDVEYKGDLNQVSISTDEEEYLCKLINQYFKKSIQPKDILWSYAGVRCLQAESGEHAHSAATASRDFKFLIDDKDHLPLLTIIGGKLTTHRTLAEDAVNKLKSYFPTMKPAWTANSPLPGGNMPDFEIFYQVFKKKYSWLPQALAYRYAKMYGTRVDLLLKNAACIDDLGKDYSQGLYQIEIDYLRQEEWAETMEDVLWRRTKLGLEYSHEELKSLLSIPI